MDKETKIPTCVGIIMDGNRRWAKAKGLKPLEGHKAGGETLKNVVKWGRDVGIKHVVFYTFSTENWKRGEEEVSYLLELIGKFLHDELDYFHKEGGVLHYAGDLSRFAPDLQEKLRKAEEKTAKNPGPHVYFALNYGGRQEILSAVKKIVEEGPRAEDITEDYFAKHLQTHPMPDPDIIIRTSGEMRLSGFLPWQGVYSELFFTKTTWPDFSKEEFLQIINDFGNRDRRIGK
ncbi:MAG: di-trans,poly-cis-decaprenylcistransferase [Candidatus Zambryskibacteria bacterium RIFOXYD1_FULL_40_13]|nr:MAG: Isoprenyl transferase [Parcubacteria group bacterium GW2011_GWF1_39_37]KKR35431.1 MAG: Isoprenyl transferase [Parcubacteria group bacterium GW2011_GWC2_40_10]KKR51922.1 MAG: Isoprenyl transferase [Parcubacteria group bacterium GW2011_GWE1_40_20]KKR65789.1 MAG: Isoprenyl transferase [Parcubacteria group bacterium GW2011_GWB1_40_5]KKR68593.1 MAG: Isoprenyl transferase [Parcubacteria group bacterium GW2011_GWF2_40_69]KKS35833.1 MAG: Isoprenyl transferase [Parcubacteria group bacterium GW2